MDRLGMEEGEVIEHKWLSKAIEGAQKRVEGHNFDIRKNLLEYDDVMNQQRRTIYKLRRQILAAGAGTPLVEYDEDPKTKAKIRSEKVVTWQDLRELALDAVEDVILSVTGAFCPTKNPSSWDIDGLTKAVRDTLNLEMNFTQAGAREEMQEQIYRVAEKNLLAREKEIGEGFNNVCQYLYLATIDYLWKEHLLSMDHLRQGIGLRGYGQKDPKQEYKKEGYESFLRMLAAINSQFVGQLMRVQPRNTAEETERLKRQMAQKQRQIFEGRAGEDGKAEPRRPAAVARQEPRIGRNDPCPCGSGKKYKKCHGSMQPTTA
jgi:preprotein translocase subunit SecA